MKFVLAFIMIMQVSSAWACTCMRPDDENALNSFQNAGHIIKAEVQLISKGWRGSGPLATLKILETHKGELEKDDVIVVQYNPSAAACGNALEEGQTYVLGMYDVRSFDTTRPSVGDYRVMNSCEQMQIRHYINNVMKKED
jgi:hypothetical protein